MLRVHGASRYDVLLYSLVGTGFLVYTGLYILPLGISIFYSATEWNGLGIPKFVGLRNFTNLFSDPNYWLSLKNTTLLILFKIAFQLLPALAVGYLLLRTRKTYRRVYRALYFLPVIVAPIATGLMFSLMYNPEIGVIDTLLSAMRLTALELNWLSNVHVVLYAVIMPEVWQFVGLLVIVFLAGYVSIPRELFESADVDGAGAFRVFYAIAVPMIWEVVVFGLILIVAGSLKSFEIPFAITGGGPGYASSYLTVYLYKNSFLSFSLGYGSSVTITILIYAFAATILLRKLLLPKRRD